MTPSNKPRKSKFTSASKHWLKSYADGVKVTVNKSLCVGVNDEVLDKRANQQAVDGNRKKNLHQHDIPNLLTFAATQQDPVHASRIGGQTCHSHRTAVDGNKGWDQRLLFRQQSRSCRERRVRRVEHPRLLLTGSPNRVRGSMCPQ